MSRSRVAVLVHLAAVSLLAFLAGCDPTVRRTLSSPTFYPTALDFWPERRAFLVGSYDDGSIEHIALGGSTGDTGNRLFHEKHADGRLRALRLRVDRPRQRLWVLDVDGVYVYALPAKRLLERIDLPETVPSKEECLPDMAVDPTSGAVYVSDVRQPIIHMITENAAEKALQIRAIHIRFEGGIAHGSGFSALVLAESPLGLIAGSAATGKLWRVDVATGVATAITLRYAIKGICGMSLVPSGTGPYSFRLPPGAFIYATTGFRNQVLRLRLILDSEGGRMAVSAPLMVAEAPISLVAFSNVVVLTSSQLGHHKDFSGDHRPLLPFRLVMVPTNRQSTMGDH